MCATVNSPTPFIERGVAGREYACDICMPVICHKYSRYAAVRQGAACKWKLSRRGRSHLPFTLVSIGACSSHAPSFPVSSLTVPPFRRVCSGPGRQGHGYYMPKALPRSIYPFRIGPPARKRATLIPAGRARAYRPHHPGQRRPARLQAFPAYPAKGGTDHRAHRALRWSGCEAAGAAL